MQLDMNIFETLQQKNFYAFSLYTTWEQFGRQADVSP